jgi:hypothetical protein
MITTRTWHTATLLLTGKVLIAGGGTSSAELFDPTIGSFTPTGDMVTSRRGHTATLLPDGRVLIVGGYIGHSNSLVASAEIYDPASGVFTALGDVSRTTQPGLPTATLLNYGKVLITGIGPNARLYDPADSSFVDAGPYSAPAPWVVDVPATLLADGRVLITGIDVYNSGLAQIYDPVTNSFAGTGGADLPCGNGSMLQPGGGGVCWLIGVDTVTLLPDGKVLITAYFDDYYVEPAFAEAYDPSTGIFSGIGNTIEPHAASTATLLPDGTVLMAGSQLAYGNADAAAELYDPASSKFDFAGNMITPRDFHTATLLPDGTILLAGGDTSTAEIYHPAVLVPSPVLYSLPGGMQGAIWHNTTGELASPSSPAVAGEVLTMYANNLIEGGVIAPQVAVGGQAVEVLYFGDAPGYPGYSQVNFRVPAAVASGPNVSVRLTYLNRPSNEVTIAVQE